MKIIVIGPSERAIRMDRRMYESGMRLMGSDFLLDMDMIHTMALIEESGRQADMKRRHAALAVSTMSALILMQYKDKNEED